MGNQHGKPGKGDVRYDPSTVGTRESMAAWHRYGVDVWDVYDNVDDLGEGYMGQVHQVRRKERGLHNQATRQSTKDAEQEAFEEQKKTPKISIRKISSRKKLHQHHPSITPPKPRPATPPKSPSRPKQGILKKSNYANPTTTVPDLDDTIHEEEIAHWNMISKDRTEQIKDHRAEILGTDWNAIEQQDSNKSLDPLSDSPKVYFKRLYACKTVLVSRIKDGKLEEVLNEIYVMRTLDHPYILRLYEIYQVKRKLWLITELCTGGDLTSRKLMEPEVVIVVEQILRALAYMHGRGICHRDLKLENVLWESKKKDATVRLIDFGLSKTYDRAEVSRKAIGTAYTLSPEIAAGTAKYTSKTDIWSLGICVWVLLSGDFPFIKSEDDMNDKFKLNRLINAKYKFGITWAGRGISTHAQNFVRKCLCKDPKDRWSAKEALDFLQQTWIPAMEQSNDDDPIMEASLKHTISSQRRRGDSSGSMDLNMEDIQRFCTYGLMKKTILMAMAHTMDRHDVGRLNEMFLAADTEDTGTLNLLELKNALLQVNPNMDDATIEKIFKGIDQDRSGEIHYAEFVAALVESQGLVTMDRLAEAFDRIDSEGKGYISHDDLRMVLGKDYDQGTVNRMIKEADFKKNGQVDYEELLRLMFEDPKSGMDAVGDVHESLRSLEGFKDLSMSRSF